MTTKFDEWKQRTSDSIMNTYGRYPIAIEKGKGCKLFSPDGKEYLDLLAGIAVVNLGHGREDLAKVMADQALNLVHVSNLFYQQPQVELAEKLLATCKADKVFFCNSGAEANEAAIKLARRYTRKVKNKEAYEIISLEQSFHGRTFGALAATGQDGIKDGFAPLPEGFKSVPMNDTQALEKAITPQTCAVMIEMVQGEGGVLPLPDEYVAQVVAICEKHDLLLIVDEIQTGLCRTGKFWAHQHYGITPDIFTSAKGLANGLPMGAMLATDQVAKGFEPGSHATTFGGGPVLSKVAAKVIDIMVNENLAQRSGDMGEFARSELEKVMAAHPDKIETVRGKGLMIGVVLTSPGQEIHKKLTDRGFILNLAHGTVLRLLPPLVIEKEDISRFCQALDQVLGE